MYIAVFHEVKLQIQWQEVCEDKQLQDLPYKVELNQWGQIVMSPAKVKHGFFQGRIVALLESLTIGGEVLTKCAVQTTDNVKVADVVWVSDARADKILEETAASIAPEICIEILSESNTTEEMSFKQLLYFQAGAQEFWICDRLGNMSFYQPEFPLETSLLVPNHGEATKLLSVNQLFLLKPIFFLFS